MNAPIATGRTVNRTLSTCAATLVLATMAGGVLAQGGGGLPGGDVWVSGLHHSPLGGATLGSPAGRRLPIHNIGSSGQDGVEIDFDSARGASCDVDLTQVLQTPGAAVTCKVSRAGDTMTGDLILTGDPVGAMGACNQVFDFGSMSATGVRWAVRDAAGAVLAEGTQPGPVLVCQCVADTTGPFNPLVWNIRTRINQLEATLQNLGLLARCTTSSVTVTGLTADPIPGAASVECFPIICITSPCPGGWTGVSSMAITARGVPSLDVSDASRVIRVRPINDPPTLSLSKSVTCWGTSNLQIEEPCAGLPENCPPAEPTLLVTGWQADDCLTIDFTDSDRVDASGILRRDRVSRGQSVDYDFVPALSAPPGENPGMTFEMQGRKWGNGHVTLMKVYDDMESAGSRLLRCDASGMGSSECVVTCLGSSGQVLHTATVGNGGSIRIDSTPARLSTNMTVARIAFATPGQCSVAGMVVPGVSSVTWEPVKPQAAVGISRVCCRGRHLHSATISAMHSDPGVINGVPHHAIGDSYIHLEDDGVTRRVRGGNLGSSGQDGIEVVCGGAYGASCDVGLGDVLAVAGGEIKIRPKGWDGTIKGTLRVTSLTPNMIGCVQDVSTTGATAMRWQALDAGGNVLAQGVHPSAVLDYTCVLMPKAGSTPSSMSLRHGGYDLKKATKRTDTACMNGACRLMIPGRPPINEVVTLRCEFMPPASMLRKLEGTQSMLVTSSAPGVSVSNPAVCNWSFGASNHGGGGGGGGGGAVSARYTGDSHVCTGFTIPVSSSPELLIDNIGSSGQDGVSIQAFETGDIPTQDDFSLSASMIAGFSLGSDQHGPYPLSSTGQMGVEFKRVPHITLLKFEVYPDPTAAAPTDFVTCDASARGSFTAMATFSDGTSIIGSVPLSHGTTCQIPCCSGYERTYGLNAQGHGHIETGCPVTVTLATGEAFANVRSITFAPVDPVTPAQVASECVVTAKGADALRVRNVHVSVPTCPADLGRQGGLLGGDGAYDNNDFVAFIDLFFNGSSGADLGMQGGIPGQDGHLDNNDFVIFIDYFFSGCP